MKFLVTGASGFIGSHISDDLLNRGYEVRCIIRKTSNLRWLKGKNIELVEASLDNKESLMNAVGGVDSIIHSAGLTAAKNYDEFLRGNRDGTKNLISVASEYSPNIQRFLYVSSQTVVGPSKSIEHPMDESSPCNPITSYGKSKREAELEVLKLKDKLPITIIRPPAVYGPRDTASFDIFKTIYKGLAPLIGMKPKYASIIHSGDLSRGIIDAAISEKSIGEIYFITSEQFYTWDQINATIIKAFNDKKTLKLKIPHSIVLSIGAISGALGKFSKKPPVFNYEKGIDFIQNFWTCSVEKAKKDLNFSQKISLEDGMRDTAIWYIENGWLK